ncbi:biotin--[acetyl-CoA-carboxylase] ligase [Thermostilla marina]
MSDRLDLDRLAESCPGVHVEFHHEIGSTNDRAKEPDVRLSDDRPWLITAERQTAGRGRGSNRWWTGEGSLAFTIVLPSPRQWPTQQFGLFALATGAAVCEVVTGVLQAENALHSVDVGMRWPNDIYLVERKVSGILVEVADGKLIVGIGVNVNNSVNEAPAELQSRVVSLRDVVGRPLDRTELLARLTQNVVSHLSFERLHATDIARRANRWCCDKGRVLTASTANRVVRGVCRGISSDGGLLLEVDGHLEEIISGTVLDAS